MFIIDIKQNQRCKMSPLINKTINNKLLGVFFNSNKT